MTKEIKTKQKALSEAVNIIDELVGNDEQKYGRFYQPTFELKNRSGINDQPSYWNLYLKFTNWTFNEKNQLTNLLEFLDSLEQSTQLYMKHENPLTFSFSFLKEDDKK